MKADRAAYLQDHHHEDRRKLGDRRVSPAVGDYALQERGKLLAENERLRMAVETSANMCALQALRDADPEMQKGWREAQQNFRTLLGDIGNAS